MLVGYEMILANSALYMPRWLSMLMTETQLFVSTEILISSSNMKANSIRAQLKTPVILIDDYATLVATSQFKLEYKIKLFKLTHRGKT